MAAEIFLIADARTDADGIAARLGPALAGTPAAALLIEAGGLDEAAYRDRVARLAPIAQEKGCAVLLDNRPELVSPLGADGVHMTGGLKALREALALLKPDFIVGTGDIGSRHEAMTRGELDVDYLMFGDRDDAGAAEMANWWAETFEVPSVWRAAGRDDPALGTIRTEFVAFALEGAQP